MPPLPFQNNTLGVSPEQLTPYWQQFQATQLNNPTALMGVASDCATVFQMTSAQLLALNATPVTIVPNPVVAAGSILGYQVPPRGFLLVPEMVAFEYIFGGTAYTAGGTTPTIQITYTGQTTAFLSTAAAIVTQSVNSVAWSITASQTVLANTVAANLGFSVSMGGTTPTLTLGNGTLNLHLLYNIYALI